MVYVYILFDACPGEHGDRTNLGVFISRKNANKKLKALKESDAYTYQYVEINRWKISDWPK